MGTSDSFTIVQRTNITRNEAVLVMPWSFLWEFSSSSFQAHYFYTSTRAFSSLYGPSFWPSLLLKKTSYPLRGPGRMLSSFSSRSILVFESRIAGTPYSFQLQPPPVGNSLFAPCAVTVRPAPSSLSEERLPNLWSQAPKPQRCAALSGMFFLFKLCPFGRTGSA